jgi:mediator of RNA polymerase II transcription subunit 14
MAKDKTWNDVRLLSFDLQTVEFAYAPVWIPYLHISNTILSNSKDYTVSITCTDQLSPSGGSFDLRFSRCVTNPTSESATFNPHDDAEPFLRNILRHGQGLASSLHRLVALLRDTLPIVAELEEIRLSAEKNEKAIDTFAKAEGWYRILYGDLRHALDFRLLVGRRVVILDGSHSLFANVSSFSKVPASTESTPANNASGFTKPSPAQQPTPGKSPGRPSTAGNDDLLGLQPIPNFNDIVREAAKDITLDTENVKITAIDVGVVCDVDAVRVAARVIHDRVVSALNP